MSANELDWLFGEGASQLFDEDGNYKDGTVPMMVEGIGIITDVACSEALNSQKYGYTFMTSDSTVYGQIDNYSSLSTINTSNNSYTTITNHDNAYIGTINTGTGSNTTINNRGIIDTINIGENATATIYNYNQEIDPKTGEYVIGIGTIRGKTDSQINVYNYGGIDEIHTGAYSNNEIDTSVGYINWLETGFHNGSKVTGADHIERKDGNGKMQYLLFKSCYAPVWVDYDNVQLLDRMHQQGWSYSRQANIKNVKVSTDNSGNVYTVVTFKDGRVTIEAMSKNGNSASFDAKAIKQYIINAKNSGFGNEAEAAAIAMGLLDKAIEKKQVTGIEKGSYEYYAQLYMWVQNELGEHYKRVELIDGIVNGAILATSIALTVYEIYTIKTMRSKALATGKTITVNEATINGTVKSRLPTEAELNGAVSEWSRMQKSLATSNRQAAKFNTGTVVYDAKTGQYYYGMNRGVQISGDSLNPTLSKMLPEKSLNDYKRGNCAEVDAVNQALNNGANMSDLYMFTINVNTGATKGMCANCSYTFNGNVANVLSK